jgi:drug/metabolite transporter (DMT)-like permease
MRTRDLTELTLLAMIWGGSFVLLRVAGPAFGPAALVELRVGIAALCLLPLLIARGAWRGLRAQALPIAVVGVLNSALPFLLFVIATLQLSAGLAAILNATTPLFTALIARVWRREPLRRSQWLGLAIGFGGVGILLGDRADWQHAATAWAVAAALAASASYGAAANYTRARLKAVEPLAVATGSQIAAAVLLAPVAAVLWPSAAPGSTAWGAAITLGIVCTGLAYILYFRLIAHAGATHASSVTFLVPVFATAWGAILLSEAVTARMVLAGCIVLVGTALVLGLMPSRVQRRPVISA